MQRAAAALLSAALLAVVGALDMSQCIAPLGMESGMIPDSDITASSCYNDGNVAPHNGRLNQERAGGAWCPSSQISAESGEWLQVELRAVHVLTAVSSQGRFGNGQGQEYAESFVLEYWRPRLARWVRYRDEHGQEVLMGNTNTYLEVKTVLSPAVWASRVRFLPRSSHRRTVCMRVELYGCLWNGGVVAYSMPAGDTRSNGVELTDATYDGSWTSGELRGGLGQLVDGVFGGDEIREASQVSPWVGWRNESRAGSGPIVPRPPPVLVFEFDRVREFSALHVYCNNKFMRDVQVFSKAVVRFSVGGQRYQEEPVRAEFSSDLIFESARNVTVKLHHRIGRFLQLELHFAARWILVSEVVFDSDVAQGNHSAERVRGGGGGAGGGANAAAGAAAGAARGAGAAAARREDLVYVAVAVGVATALAVLVTAAVMLVVHRHRHRKCFASPAPKAAPTQQPTTQRANDAYSECGLTGASSWEHKGACALKSDEYQEPYQQDPCPYGGSLLEMRQLRREDARDPGPDEGCYEYAVPELSATPLLPPRNRHSGSSRGSPAPSPPPLAALHLAATLSMDEVECGVQGAAGAHAEWEGEGGATLRVGPVPELPRHRLRMISKLAEGAFGAVYVAEAEGVPEYGGSCAAAAGDKRLVAVKFLSQDASRDEREAFEHDVRILAGLSHPCLARVLGASGAGGGPRAVVLEYLAGGELCGALRAAPPPRAAALLLLARQLAAGMRYLEALGFVHRDLAARNCLLGAGYALKIADFGTDSDAYARDYCDVGGRVVPLRWSAPEAALLGHHSTRADVFSFGVTLWEVFWACRWRPYARLGDEAVAAALHAGGAEPGPRAPACPRAVHRLVRRCWRREPRDRPTFRDACALLDAIHHGRHHDG